MKRVTHEDIILMNEAYLAAGTYSGAAAATGWSASTVKKYIIPNYQSERQFKIENIELPPITEVANRLPPWYNLTCLTSEEEEEIKVLWAEMII